MDFAADSYMILAPNEMKVIPDERKASQVCLETVKLDPDLYRIGHTKARNRLNPSWFIFTKHLQLPLFNCQTWLSV